MMMAAFCKGVESGENWDRDRQAVREERGGSEVGVGVYLSKRKFRTGTTEG